MWFLEQSFTSLQYGYIFLGHFCITTPLFPLNGNFYTQCSEVSSVLQFAVARPMAPMPLPWWLQLPASLVQIILDAAALWCASDTIGSGGI